MCYTVLVTVNHYLRKVRENLMRKKELQELVTELQNIYDELLVAPSDVYRQTSLLIRLSTCMKELKTYPLYSPLADNILNAIQDYANDPGFLETVIPETMCLISILTEELERDSVMDTLKRYEEAKTKITKAIPEEVKDTCTVAVEQVKNVYKDVAEQASEVRKNVEKKAKSKLRSWLLSNDEE